VLDRCKEESFERCRSNVGEAISNKLSDIGWKWEDLAEQIGNNTTAEALREKVGDDNLTLKDLNEIIHCFSCELYIIFRPRFPYVNS